MPDPLWPGLWEQEYSDDADLNPWCRYAINNSDGEALAVWRALAWELTAGRSRFAVPAYYRDEAAQLRGMNREAVQLVRWEYEVDVEQPDWLTADIGFVPARACVPLRPMLDPWQREHAGFAGLFNVTSFRHLTDLALAVAGDATMEITLFALHDPGRATVLASTLNQAHRPDLTEILQPGDIFVDLAVVHDLGAGAASYLTIKTPEPTDEVDHLAEHFSEAFRRYTNQASRIRTFNEFHNALDHLLAPPPQHRHHLTTTRSTAHCHTRTAACPCVVAALHSFPLPAHRHQGVARALVADPHGDHARLRRPPGVGRVLPAGHRTRIASQV